MIGKWHFLDCVPCREQFLYGHPKFSDDQGDIWLKDIYFMPGGLSSWIISGWTKGAFMTRFNYPAHTYRHGLSIEPVSYTHLQPKCPPEKEAAITEALKFFGMI